MRTRSRRGTWPALFTTTTTTCLAITISLLLLPSIVASRQQATAVVASPPKNHHKRQYESVLSALCDSQDAILSQAKKQGTLLEAALLRSFCDGNGDSLEAVRRNSLLYAASLVNHPAALMASAIKATNFLTDNTGSSDAACPASARYTHLSSQIYVQQQHQQSRAVSLRLPNSNLHNGLDFPVNAFAQYFGDIMAGDRSLALPLGQRLMLGGDKLPQSYVEARKQLTVATLEGSGEAAALLGVAHTLGLGGPVNKDLAMRLFFLAAKVYNSALAMNALAVGILEALHASDFGEETTMAFAEAKQLMNSAMEELTMASFNVASLDLLGGGALRARIFVHLAMGMGYGVSPASHLVGGLLMGGLAGPRSCSKALPLLQRVAKRSLYSNEMSHVQGLDDSQYKAQQNVLGLLRLNAAEVEQGLWLSANAQFFAKANKRDWLIGSALQGRREAQLSLALNVDKMLGEKKIANEERKDYGIITSLDGWFEDSGTELPTYTKDELTEALLRTAVHRHPRWLLGDMQENELAMAEVSASLGWMSLIGRVGQKGSNIREAFIQFRSLTDINPSFWAMKNLIIKANQIVILLSAISMPTLLYNLGWFLVASAAYHGGRF